MVTQWLLLLPHSKFVWALHRLYFLYYSMFLTFCLMFCICVHRLPHMHRSGSIYVLHFHISSSIQIHKCSLHKLVKNWSISPFYGLMYYTRVGKVFILNRQISLAPLN